MNELSGLQIFKYLPAAKKQDHTNCKECGCPTCMAFALKLSKHQVKIENCCYAPDELKNIYIQSSKVPQKTVEINGIKIGGENVLYRHEKTFNNPCPIAVSIDVAKNNWEKKLERIKNFEIKCVNEIFKVDLIILKNSKQQDIDFSCITFEKLKSLPIKIINDNDFKSTSQELITIRKKAVLDKDESCSEPVCVWFKHSENLNDLCSRAAYYICKYANMIVFEDFDESLFTSLIMLRQNIYTDPQKPLQVEPNIYEFNNPDENSLIFMTTNFALTFFAVANELESLPVPSYLIVTPSDGMSVLTAWSAEKFTAKKAAKMIKKYDFANKMKNRKIIIPGLLAHMKTELQEEIKDFEIVVGTVNAFEIGDFVKTKLKAFTR